MALRIPISLMFGSCVVLMSSRALALQTEPGDNRFGGTLVFASGKTLRVERFKRLFPTIERHVGELRVRHETILRTIELADIERIAFIETKKGSSYILQGNVLSLRLRNGRQATVVVADTHRGELEVAYVDPLTGKLQIQEYRINDKKNPISELVFTSDVGSLRWSETSGSYFPPSYNFDPYTGSKLIWRTPRPNDRPKDLEVHHWACPACRSCFNEGPSRCKKCGGADLLPARTNILDKGADYFLRRAGIDASSRQADVAKKLSSAWLNPFASEAEIEGALRSTVAAATGP